MGLFSSDKNDKPNGLNTPLAEQHAALAAWHAKHNPHFSNDRAPRPTDAGRAYLAGRDDARKGKGGK